VFYACVAADAAAVGFDDAFIYKELNRAHAERRVPMQQLLREESLTIFALWQQQEKKTLY